LWGTGDPQPIANWKKKGAGWCTRGVLKHGGEKSKQITTPKQVARTGQSMKTLRVSLWKDLKGKTTGPKE